jgi:hypothetical protein
MLGPKTKLLAPSTRSLEPHTKMGTLPTGLCAARSEVRTLWTEMCDSRTRGLTSSTSFFEVLTKVTTLRRRSPKLSVARDASRDLSLAFPSGSPAKQTRATCSELGSVSAESG